MGGVVCGGHCRINAAVLRVVLFNVFFSFFSTRVAVGCLAIGLLTESFYQIWAGGKSGGLGGLHRLEDSDSGILGRRRPF